LYTNVTTATPRIKAYNLEAVLRRGVTMAYIFKVLLASNITRLDGTTETVRTAQSMWEEIKIAANTSEPVLVELPDQSFRGMITDLRLRQDRYSIEAEDTPVWEQVVTISLIEMS
jgi:hypothetical protein